MGNQKSKKVTTPPKGRPTARRDVPPSGRARRRAQVQWAIIGLALLGVMVAAYFAGPGSELVPGL